MQPPTTSIEAGHMGNDLATGLGIPTAGPSQDHPDEEKNRLRPLRPVAAPATITAGAPGGSLGAHPPPTHAMRKEQALVVA